MIVDNNDDLNIQLSDNEEPTEPLITEYKDINDMTNKGARYLFIANNSHSKAYIKLALYNELFKADKSLKGRFQTFKKDSKSKKQIADLYQIESNGEYTFYLLLKEGISCESYKFIFDFFFNGDLKVSNITLFSSKFYSSFFGLSDKELEENKNKLYFLKNSIQAQSNQMIPGEEIPFFNGFTGLFAYIFTKSNIIKVPCVLYLATYEENEVSLRSVSAFERCQMIYGCLKNKLSEDHIKSLDLSKIFYEFNSIKTSLYS